MLLHLKARGFEIKKFMFKLLVVLLPLILTLRLPMKLTTGPKYAADTRAVLNNIAFTRFYTGLPQGEREYYESGIKAQ
jgi:hypothetical protein